jgi:predicted TIM-barrel fold metal-dependent hydrolase
MMHDSRGRAELSRGTSALKQIIVSISLMALLPGCTGLESSSPNGQAADARGLPIIDMHMHATPIEAYPSEWGTPPFRNPVTGELSAATTNEAIMAASVRAMTQFNIVKAVVSGPLDHVHRWQAAAPDRVIGGVSLTPGVGLPDIEILRREFESGRVRVLGELGLSYLGLTPNDPKLEPYLALAERFDIPVALHTGAGPPRAPYEGAPKSRVALGNPLLLEEVLVRHPKLRVYLMHAGEPWFEGTVAIMTTYPQVYADLGVLDWVYPPDVFYEYLQRLIRRGLGKQLMFGSDQMVWPEMIGRAIATIESAPGLTESQSRDILHNNAARFLRLQNDSTVEGNVLPSQHTGANAATRVR